MIEPREETEKRIVDFLQRHGSCNLQELRNDTGKKIRYDSAITIIRNLEKQGRVQVRYVNERSWIVTWIGEK